MIEGFPKNIFFVGIGGSGVSGLARILKANGHDVSGSDQEFTATIGRLRENGINCLISHQAENLPVDSGLLIYSPAIPENNPERQAAALRNIGQLSYPQALGKLTEKFKTIAVCGTHGKTTTTAMAAAAFMNAGKDPNVLVGAPIKELNNLNSRIGESEYFILEACEYKRAFLNYSPQIILLNNIEADHLDYYKDIDDYRGAFVEFINRLPAGGLMIANLDDANVRSLIAEYREPKFTVISYGSAEDADYIIKGNHLYHQQKEIAALDLKIPGVHNKYNASAVIALINNILKPQEREKGIDGVLMFGGASRRFELKGKIDDTIIIDDYAHHPTEIKATLSAIREKYGKSARVLCVFQPHQYNRTLNLLEDFATAFSGADEIIVPNIFKVRDKAADLEKMNEELFVKEISKHHPRAKYGGGIPRTEEEIYSRLNEFDIVLTLGAGDIYLLGEKLIKKRQQN